MSPACDHVVQFYETDAFLCDKVGDFLRQSLHAGQPAIAIVTGEHGFRIRARLREGGIDVDRSLDTAELVLLDARETLEKVSSGGHPNWRLFASEIGGLFERLAPGSCPRAYGEMVDVAWREGRTQAALELEAFWNRLGQSVRLWLLCGYALRNFAERASAEAFSEICRAHSRSLPTESVPAGGCSAEQLRALCLLEQRASCLAHEVERGKELELELRRALEERRRTEEQLARHEEAVRRQNEKLEEAVRAKDEFLAMLGHELRNPIAPIRTATHLMRLRGNDSREVVVIERQVSHLTRLVDDLLDISRVTRAKIELRTRRIELSEVVARAIETASPLLEQGRHRLDVLVPHRGLAIDADLERMSQVVANLLTNACKYSPPESRIRVLGQRRDGRVRLSVVDKGIGIEPSMLGKVFDLFVQGRQSLDRAAGGLGIGLAIVKGLVQLHGGTVHASSAGPGKGSEFAVELPAGDAGAAEEPGAAPARAKAPASSAKRILVVDDNHDAAELLADALSALGHEVATAHDGPSALATARSFHPQVALLDLGLPVMDGYELARHLRELERPGLRLVAVTGYGQESDRQRSREAGFEQHLVKPVDLSGLERLLADPP